jgi:hypothetical protein
MDDLTDHDMLRRIYDWIYEPETGAKASIAKNTQIIWGNGQITGLVARVNSIEKQHVDEEETKEKREHRIYQVAVMIAGVVGTVVAVVARELMRHFGI